MDRLGGRASLRQRPVLPLRGGRRRGRALDPERGRALASATPGDGDFALYGRQGPAAGFRQARLPAFGAGRHELAWLDPNGRSLWKVTRRREDPVSDLLVQTWALGPQGVAARPEASVELAGFRGYPLRVQTVTGGRHLLWTDPPASPGTSLQVAGSSFASLRPGVVSALPGAGRVDAEEGPLPGRWLASSRDLRTVVTGTFRGATVWRMHLDETPVRAEELCELWGAGDAAAVAISPDGAWALGVDCDVAQLWDLRRAREGHVHEAAVLRGHTDSIRSVSFLRGSRWAVTAGEDGTVRLWDLRAAEAAGR